MKKVIALALAVVMLASVACCLGISASADEAVTFWLTHYEDNTVEGAGVVYQNAAPSLGWRLHAAFAPIAGVENGYEITEVQDNLSTGEQACLTLPEGGFIYCINVGNDYPALGMAGPDYTSDNCNNMVAFAKTWAVGDQFIITGIDPNGADVPTSTPSLNWYDDEYVCTATIAPYVPGQDPVNPDELTNVALGKDYVTSDLYPSGSDNKNYPDEDGISLTDGEKHPETNSYAEVMWAGFNINCDDYKENGYSSITVDLGDVYALNSASITAATINVGSGIKGLASVTVLVSDDGVNFTEAGSVADIEDPSDIHYLDTVVDIAGATGRYVEFRFTGHGNWMFVSEVEVLAGGSAPLMEEIVVDGDPTDTGYINAEPFTKGQWQYVAENDPTPELVGGYVVRTDDENVYLAVGIEGASVQYVDATYQTGATNFRIWVQGDEAEGRSFFDVTADGQGGWLTYLAKTATDVICAAGGDIEGGLFVEFCFPKADLSINEAFDLMVTYSAPQVEDGDKNPVYNAYHFTPVDEMPAGWSGNNSCYAHYVCADIALGELAPIDPVDPVDTYVEEIAAMVGEANADAKFDVALDSVVSEDGKTVTVTLSIENVSVELTGVVFKFCYDAERMTLTTPKKSDNSLDFVAEGFGDKWENLTKEGDEAGVIEFQMIVADDLTQVLTADGTYTATFTFDLNEDFDKAGAWVPCENLRGMMTGFQSCLGNGNYTVAEIEVEESSEDESSEETSTPTPTGDAGIILFAVMGVIAVAGAATVIKVRH